MKMTRGSSTLLLLAALLVVVLVGTSSAMPSPNSHSDDGDLTWDDLGLGAEAEDHLESRHKRQTLTGNLALDAARIP